MKEASIPEPFSLKPGAAYCRINGQWVPWVADAAALQTATPAGQCYIDGAHCVDFRDDLGREWAQIEDTARDPEAKRAESP